MSTPVGQKAHAMLRQCEILADSGSVINNSCNIKSVISRVESYESALKFLTNCSAADLKMCRLKTPEQLNAMYNSWLKNKNSVINKAILRAYEDTVFQASKLKTIKGQDARVSGFFNSCAELPGLNADNLRYLQVLIQKHMEKIANECHTESMPVTGKNKQLLKYIQTVQSCQEKINNSGSIQVVTKNIRILLDTLKSLNSYTSAELEEAGFTSEQGSPSDYYKYLDSVKHQIVAQVPGRTNYKKSYKFQSLPKEADNIIYDFMELYSLADKPGSASQKLEHCERALSALPDFVMVNLEQDGELFEPPAICYLSVDMCLRLGFWEKAIQIANFCNSCNAYFSIPEEYGNTIAHIKLYQNAATKALMYIKQNPGCLQKDMYKVLNGQVDHDCLQHFLRCSEQVAKEKFASTNKLYVM